MKSFLLRYLPILLWMAQIFATSAHSNPADLLPRFLLRFTWNNRFLGQRLFFLLGPVGHMFNFAMLAFLIARALAWRTPLDKQQARIAVGLSTLYGITDEIHQAFVPDRTFQVWDILVDVLGALVGVGLFMLIRYWNWQRVKHAQLLL